MLTLQVLGNWHSTKSYNSAFSEQDLVILILIVVLNWFSLLLSKHGTFLIFKNVLETELQYVVYKIFSKYLEKVTSILDFSLLKQGC